MKHTFRIITANSLGTFFEYFDYALYGFTIPIIAPLFFPSETPAMSMMLAWSTLFISLIFRPFASIIFGHFGDRLGRSKMLSFTIFLMALSTVILGLLPTYNDIGILAPILLIICRILQSFAVSGEYNGASIYLLESFKKRSSSATSMVVFACGLGVLTASLLVYLFSSSVNTSSTTIYFSSWRWPFIIAGLLVGIIGVYLRKTLPETPEFYNIRNQDKILSNPVLTVLQTKKIVLIFAIILSGYSGTATYILTVYLSSYFQTTLHLKMAIALIIVTMANFIGTLFTPCFGFLADARGHRNVMIIALILTILLAIPFFLLFQFKNILVITILTASLCICSAAYCAPLVSFLPGLFPPEMRLSAMGLGFNLGAALIGGLSPILITYFLSFMHNPIIPGIYLTISALLTFIILWNMNSFLKQPIGINYAKPI